MGRKEGTIVGGNIAGDFDGTFTDGLAMQEQYQGPYIAFVAARLGLSSINEIVDIIPGLQNEIKKNIGNYGWMMNGTMVSPPADYITWNTVLLTEAVKRLYGDNKIVQDNKELSDMLTSAFRFAYSQTQPVWKEDSEYNLRRLKQTGRFFLVTNSHTIGVESALNDYLGEGHGIPVVGNAQKYMVDEGWTTDQAWRDGEVLIPSTIPLSNGFPYEPHLRRRIYDGLLNARNVKSVFGDIFMLDLLILHAKRLLTGEPFRTALVQTPGMTPNHEVEYYKSIEKDEFDMTSESVTDIVDWILGKTNLTEI